MVSLKNRSTQFHAASLVWLSATQWGWCHFLCLEDNHGEGLVRENVKTTITDKNTKPIMMSSLPPGLDSLGDDLTLLYFRFLTSNKHSSSSKKDHILHISDHSGFKIRAEIWEYQNSEAEKCVLEWKSRVSGRGVRGVWTRCLNLKDD